jgi:hypothetical protein
MSQDQVDASLDGAEDIDSSTQGALGDPAAPRSGRRRPVVVVVAATAACLLLLGAGQLITPTRTAVLPAPVVEPVASTEFVCPITLGSSAVTTVVSAGVAPLPGVTDGTATLSELSTRPTTKPLVVSAPGTAVFDVIRGTTVPPRLARATGSFAAGFSADQIMRSGQGSARGLAASPCQRPSTESWLIGGASTVGRATSILLVNDDDRPAQVDLLVFGAGGEIASPGGSGIVVPARGRRGVRLVDLAPNQTVTAVHVIARSGRVVASALTTAAKGLIPLGMAILPTTQAETRVIIPGVPANLASARLILVAPDADTVAQVALLTPDGAISPAGMDSISLTAGKVVSLDLTAALDGQAAGIAITSDSPVAAGVTVTIGTGTELREMDSTAGTPVLTAPGVVAGLQGGTFRHALAIAAPDATAQVRLDLYGARSSDPVWSSVVTVNAGTSRRVAIPVTTPHPDGMLIITPLSGGLVHVTREYEQEGARGPMLGLAPVYPTRATTTVPPVVAVPGSALAP